MVHMGNKDLKIIDGKKVWHVLKMSFIGVAYLKSI